MQESSDDAHGHSNIHATSGSDYLVNEMHKQSERVGRAINLPYYQTLSLEYNTPR